MSDVLLFVSGGLVGALMMWGYYLGKANPPAS